MRVLQFCCRRSQHRDYSRQAGRPLAGWLAAINCTQLRAASQRRRRRPVSERARLLACTHVRNRRRLYGHSRSLLVLLLAELLGIGCPSHFHGPTSRRRETRRRRGEAGRGGRKRNSRHSHTVRRLTHRPPTESSASSLAAAAPLPAATRFPAANDDTSCHSLALASSGIASDRVAIAMCVRAHQIQRTQHYCGTQFHSSQGRRRKRSQHWWQLTGGDGGAGARSDP